MAVKVLPYFEKWRNLILTPEFLFKFLTSKNMRFKTENFNSNMSYFFRAAIGVTVDSRNPQDVSPLAGSSDEALGSVVMLDKRKGTRGCFRGLTTWFNQSLTMRFVFRDFNANLRISGKVSFLSDFNAL